MGWLGMNIYRCLKKSATLLNRSSTTSTATLLGRETQLMRYSLLQMSLYGLIYTSNNGEGSDSRHAERLGEGQYFGGELLEWVLTPASDDMSNLSKVPLSSKTMKTHTKVEAFALMAHDLKRIWQSKLSQLGQEESEFEAASFVQRI